MFDRQGAKNKLAQFFETRCITVTSSKLTLILLFMLILGVYGVNSRRLWLAKKPGIICQQ